MSELLRADYEYQKEIRRRQMTDRAKIGLLVGMNIQQFQTNQLLAQNLHVACQTNAILRQISDTLDQVAGMQATHFEQVQRERHLKEVIYQFDKFLTETEQYDDPIAAAYGVKRLFEVIDRPSHSFTTADLTDFDDKRRFDELLARGKAILRGLSKERFEELEEFEKLLGIYHERRTVGFDVERAYPKKQRVRLPKQYRSAPWDRVKPAPPPSLLSWLLPPPSPPKNYTPQEREKWEAGRQAAQAEADKANLKIDEYNSTLEETRQKAKRIFDATMSEMRTLINGFLGQHPAIQQFVARV